MTPTVAVYDDPNFDDLLEPGEQLVWTGKPVYGQRFFQVIGYERTWHLSMFAAVVIMWLVVPFVSWDPYSGYFDAIWFLSIWTVVFVGGSLLLASDRQYIMSSSIYFLTDRRAIVCRRGRNWHLNYKLYVVSCPLVPTYPYEVIRLRPYASVQVGTLLSKDVIQPFGPGLSHGGQSPLLGRVNMPVVFEAVDKPDDLMALIQTQLDLSQQSSEI